MPKRVRDTAGTALAATDEWAEAERLAAELASDELPDEPAPEGIDERMARLAREDTMTPEPELPGLTAAQAAETAKAIAADARPSALDIAASPQRLSEPASKPGRPESPEREREALRTLGAQRDRLSTQLEKKEDELWAAIQIAHIAGVPKLTISKDAGVSRQTVYNVLAKG